MVSLTFGQRRTPQTAVLAVYLTEALRAMRKRAAGVGLALLWKSPLGRTLRL